MHASVPNLPPGQSVRYWWEIRHTSNTVVVPAPAANAAAISFGVSAGETYSVCVLVQWLDGKTECRKQLCQEVTATRCAPKPCTVEGDILAAFDAKRCAYQLGFSNAAALSNVSYQWNVARLTAGAPLAVPLLPSSTDAAPYFQQVAGASYQVTLTLRWKTKECECTREFTRTLQGRECKTPCEVDPAFKASRSKRDCSYSVELCCS